MEILHFCILIFYLIVISFRLIKMMNLMVMVMVNQYLKNQWIHLIIQVLNLNTNFHLNHSKLIKWLNLYQKIWIEFIKNLEFLLFVLKLQKVLKNKLLMHQIKKLFMMLKIKKILIKIANKLYWDQVVNNYKIYNQSLLKK